MIRSRRNRPHFAALQDKGCVVLDEASFLFELLKEIHRSDRRRREKELGVVRLVFRAADPSEFVETKTFASCKGRLRFTDVCGWYQGSLAFLLPETDRNGALTVANQLTKICVGDGIAVDTEVSIYPNDDELISLANEVRFPHDTDDDLSEFEGDSREFQVNDSEADCHFRVDHGHHGPGAPHASVAVQEVQRTQLKQSVPVQPEPYACETGRVVEVRRRFIPSTKTPWWKRAIDVMGAATGLVLLSPVLLGAAAAIRLGSKGPVFFRQKREGKDGKVFEILKFRTMVVDAESQQAGLRDQSEQDGPAFKLTNDPRVTSVGKYLRKSCIDELPQLINILKGDMSLVGPRPLPVSESQACTAWQRARLTVLPGLTCTWQAYGGRDIKFEQWMRMDLDYIVKRSFLFDLKLIFDTACIAVMHRGSV